MKKILSRVVVCLLALFLTLSTIPQPISAKGLEPSLEIVAEYWGTNESSFTIRCTGVADVSQITVWTAVYRGPIFYGFSIAENQKGSDGLFHITVKHLPFDHHDTATVKVFLLDAQSFAPQSESAQEELVMTSQKVYKTYLGSEVTSLNFLDNPDSNSSTPASYAMSQLWRMYPNANGTNYVWIDDLAVGDPIQVDDYNWQIKLRKGATFQDGTPINADTWIYTFQQQLDPKLQNRMATFLYDNSVTIVNGEAYFLQGTEGYPTEVKWEDVGLKKIDEYTIQITTEDNHTDPNDIKKHFDNRNNTPVHPAMWEACLNSAGTATVYGTTLDYFIGCGPYVFAKWDKNNEQIYVKNNSHWLAEYFHFDQIQVRIVPEMNARVELFEAGELHALTPDSNIIESYLNDPRMTTYGSLSVPHIDVNCKNPLNPVSGSVNYRKALYHAINREYVAEHIFGHMQPAGTYISSQAGLLHEAGIPYRESVYGQSVTDLVESWSAKGEHYGYNPELALEYLNNAISECGVTEDQLPIQVILALDEGDHEWIACTEYLQEQWATIFKGKLELEIVTYAGMSTTGFKKTGDDKWDLSPNDWTRSVSRTYPHTAFYYYLSSYHGRPNNYTDETFETQYDYCESIKLSDYDTLLAETQKLEELYLEKVIHIPVYQHINFQLFSDNLELPVKTYIPGFGWGAVFGTGGDVLEADDIVPIPAPPAIPTEVPDTEPDKPDAPELPDEPEIPSESAPFDPTTYKTYLTSEVTSLNFLDNVDSNASTPASYAMSQLWRMYPNEDGTNYIWLDDLAVGDPIKVNDHNWQIKLREGATFQDGTPINADTWIYTFQQMLDPKLQNRMATFLYDNSVTIVNGEEYLLQGTEGYPAEVKWEDVGLKKIDDYTIQITTEDIHGDPNSIKKHFDFRCHTPIHREMWEDCLSSDGMSTSYGSDLEHFVGCGPYFFDTWMYEDSQIYTKNEEHWLADYFPYENIEVRILVERKDQVQSFEAGEIYSLSPDAYTVDQYIDDPRLTTYGSTLVTHIDINCKNPANPISGSVNYRKALYHAINREYAAENFFGYMQPVGTYINSQAGLLSDSGLTYRESQYGNAVTELVESWGPYGYNPQLALDYLNAALLECDVSVAVLPITIKYCIDEGDTELLALGEYLKEQWTTIFKGKLELEIVTYAGMSATSFKKTGDDQWDLSPNAWSRSASRTYPHTAFYYYLSSYSGRPNNYTDEDFEAQYNYCESIKLGDYETLLSETQNLEELYLEKVIHIPLYQSTNFELFHEDLPLPVKTYIPGFGWGLIYGSGGVETNSPSAPSDLV